MSWSKIERKHVHVTSLNLWHIAMGSMLERYYSAEPWAVQARFINKEEAETYLHGTIYIECDDAEIFMNLRMRHRQAYFAPSYFPENLDKYDSILLARKREQHELPAEPGFDNRYHFFLITWVEPGKAALEFDAASAQPQKGSRAQCVKRKCNRILEEEVTAEMLVEQERKKLRRQKGMSAKRYANRLRG
jgi:hypothetical protein